MSNKTNNTSNINNIYKIVALSLKLIGCLMLLTACDLTEKRYYEATKLEYAEEQSEIVTVSEYKDEVIQRVMNAARVDRYYSKKQTISYDVTITDYFTDGGVKIILVADTLIIDEHTNTLTAKGGVVITREEGTLKTEHLIWNQNNDEVSSPVEAVIIRGDNILKGFELTTDTEFSVINMKRVTAEGHLYEEDIDW